MSWSLTISSLQIEVAGDGSVLVSGTTLDHSCWAHRSQFPEDYFDSLSGIQFKWIVGNSEEIGVGTRIWIYPLEVVARSRVSSDFIEFFIDKYFRNANLREPVDIELVFPFYGPVGRVDDGSQPTVDELFVERYPCSHESSVTMKMNFPKTR